MTPRLRSGATDRLVRSQVAKLAECDENLVLIASELTSLQDELTQFRTEAEELARLFSDREPSLVETQSLEQERAPRQRSHPAALAVVEPSPVHGVSTARELTSHEHEAAETAIAGHVRFIASATGYFVSESDEPCPAAGQLVEVDAQQYVVARSGCSPFPSDARRCAFLVPTHS